MSKVLVVYFSRCGEQYGVGDILKGNTAIVAEIIAKKTGADLFEIKVLKDNYPNKYTPLIQYAKKEKQENARPEIIGSVDTSKYSEVFLGYPNWWGDMPMPVYTFLESSNLDNSKIYHFCTHEGSGGVVKDGFEIYGHTAQNNPETVEQKIENWLEKIGFKNV